MKTVNALCFVCFGGHRTGRGGQKPDLPQDENGYYEIASASDLAAISAFPEEDFVLTADIVLTEAMSPLCVELQFMGVLDGAGHKITGYTSTEGGLIHMNAGTIKNLGMEAAGVEAPSAFNIGILCNTNSGVIEGCYTTGSISGQATTGGVVGYLNGTIRDCYSTARVSSSARQAGGVVGISGRGSTTPALLRDRFCIGRRQRRRHHRLHLRNDQRQRQLRPERFRDRPPHSTRIGWRREPSAAKLPTSAPILPGRICRFPKQKTDTRFASLMGEGKSLEEIHSQDTFKPASAGISEPCGKWDETAQRPVLKNCTEKTDETPTLPQDENGYYKISSAEDLAQISKFPAENYILTQDIDLAGKTVGQLCQSTSFSGVFDGAGYRLFNFTSETGGLFKGERGRHPPVGDRERRRNRQL